MEYIIILVTFIVAFLMSFFSYRQGLKDGRSINKDEPLKPLIQPKPKLSEEEKEKANKLQKGFENMMKFANGGTQNGGRN